MSDIQIYTHMEFVVRLDKLSPASRPGNSKRGERWNPLDEYFNYITELEWTPKNICTFSQSSKKDEIRKFLSEYEFAGRTGRRWIYQIEFEYEEDAFIFLLGCS